MIQIDDYATVREYLNEILAPWDPVTSPTTRSHVTLGRLFRQQGRDHVESLITQYFARFGPNGETDPFNPYSGDNP